MDRQKFERVMEHIIAYIERAGYNPYEQIRAYLLTGDAKYITREGKAREFIQHLDKEDIKRYIRGLCR